MREKEEYSGNKFSKFDFNLFLLRLLYKELLEILDTACGGNIAFRNLQINRYYTVLKNFIEKILKKEGFEELAKESPELFNSLVGDIEEIDLEWEYLSREAYEFFGKIEKIYINRGCPSFGIPEELKQGLENIAKAKIAHKKYDKEAFEKLLTELQKSKIKLSKQKIKFDDENATIEISNQKCALPPYKNEHYFCRAVFEHKANEPVDWSIIYEKITGYYQAYYGKPPASRRHWRLVYDTMRSLNERIKETVNTDEDLFVWQEKTVKRKY